MYLGGWKLSKQSLKSILDRNKKSYNNCENKCTCLFHAIYIHALNEYLEIKENSNVDSLIDTSTIAYSNADTLVSSGGDEGKSCEIETWKCGYEYDFLPWDCR